jgi:hypothetical protein
MAVSVPSVIAAPAAVDMDPDSRELLALTSYPNMRVDTRNDHEATA